MLQGKLDKESIAQPELWRMCLMPSAEGIDVALYPPVAREEIHWCNISFEPGLNSQLKSLENAIYDNPLLLSDFRHIDCIVDSKHQMLLPSTEEAENHELLLRAACPSMPDSVEIMEFPIGSETKIIMGLDSEHVAFLRRTFYNVRFHSRLALLCNYVLSKCPHLKAKRVATFISGKQLTLVATDNGRILAANNFKFETAADAAYYTMACITELGFNDQPTMYDIAVQGEPLNQPDTLASTLKNYVPNICAVPFPTLRYKASRSTLETPFPLLILPICE